MVLAKQLRKSINKVHFQKIIQIKNFKFENIPQSNGPKGTSNGECAWSQTVEGLLTTATAGNSLHRPTQQFH